MRELRCFADVRRDFRPEAPRFCGRVSVPTRSARVAAIRHDSVGTEVAPTNA
ncbi:DUF6053 domain-containing protein [Lysobacter enzymogenes]|uniref:DUF6053 domain-containing protein n=1 Tax=Lysobacter enzymogenes TaxID=69 RepID=UPI003D18D352